MFTIYGGLDPKSDVDRLLYITRKDRRRGLIAIEDCVKLSVRGLEEYVNGSEEKLLQAVRSIKCFEKSKGKDETSKLGGESFTWPLFEIN